MVYGDVQGGGEENGERDSSRWQAPVMPISSFSTVPPSVVGLTAKVLTVRGRELTPRICVIGLMRSSSAIVQGRTE